jgi:hypothetical protein
VHFVLPTGSFLPLVVPPGEPSKFRSASPASHRTRIGLCILHHCPYASDSIKPCRWHAGSGSEAFSRCSSQVQLQRPTLEGFFTQGGARQATDEVSGDTSVTSYHQMLFVSDRRARARGEFTLHKIWRVRLLQVTTISAPQYSWVSALIRFSPDHHIAYFLYRDTQTPSVTHRSCINAIIINVFHSTRLGDLSGRINHCSRTAKIINQLVLLMGTRTTCSLLWEYDGRRGCGCWRVDHGVCALQVRQHPVVLSGLWPPPLPTLPLISTHTPFFALSSLTLHSP